MFLAPHCSLPVILKVINVDVPVFSLAECLTFDGVTISDPGEWLMSCRSLFWLPVNCELVSVQCDAFAFLSNLLSFSFISSIFPVFLIIVSFAAFNDLIFSSDWHRRLFVSLISRLRISTVLLILEVSGFIDGSVTLDRGEFPNRPEFDLSGVSVGRVCCCFHSIWVGTNTHLFHSRSGGGWVWLLLVATPIEIVLPPPLRMITYDEVTLDWWRVGIWLLSVVDLSYLSDETCLSLSFKTYI